MRVLLTNNTLGAHAGSELYVRDVALALLRRGHEPIAFSTLLGAVAQELREATVPVLDDLTQLAQPPDVIHGQHHLDAMIAMLHFPHVPAVHFCHGWLPWEELPPRFATIRRYVAVDDLCAERLQSECGIPPRDIRIVRNFVDLRRVPLRDGLPEQPRRALVFSNNAREEGYLGVIRRACATRNIEVDVIGIAADRAHARPESVLGNYALVFAKARAALEALASGAAVIACDAAGLAGMVTRENYATWRKLNFGIRTLRDPVSVEALQREIDRYDATEATQIAHDVRRDADMEPAVDAIVELYTQAIADFRAAPAPPANVLIAQAGAYLNQIASNAKLRHHALMQQAAAEQNLQTEHARAESLSLDLHASVQDRERLAQEVQELHAAQVGWHERLGAAQAESNELRIQLDTATHDRERLAKHVLELQSARADGQARLDAAQAQSSDLHLHLTASAHECERLAQQVRELQRIQADMHERLDAERAQSRDLRLQLDASAQDNKRLAQQLREWHAAQTGWQARLDEAQAQSNVLRTQCAALRASASWRITAPLRALYDLPVRLMGRTHESEPTASPQPNIDVQRAAEKMIQEQGFLGVPVATFAQGGREQLVALLREGMRPDSRVLEFGCGCLRIAWWLVRFLEPEGYCGIEPARTRVDCGLRYLFAAEDLAHKRPRFAYNADFDSSIFGTRFDFFVARSIWTHASKQQLLSCLNAFVRDSADGATLLASYLPARSADEDYRGDSWVGTSHESDVPGVIRHALAWIVAQCASRGLTVEEIDGIDCDSQSWLRVRKRAR